jgi:hypothetical protein
MKFKRPSWVILARRIETAITQCDPRDRYLLWKLIDSMRLRHPGQRQDQTTLTLADFREGEALDEQYAKLDERQLLHKIKASMVILGSVADDLHDPLHSDLRDLGYASTMMRHAVAELEARLGVSDARARRRKQGVKS